MLKDFSFSALVAGFVSVLVGFTSTVAIILQAATNLHATPEQTASWLWAIGIGMGIPTILLSVTSRQPILVAWSTPGAALIVSAAHDGKLSMAQATGAFLVSAALITLAGFSGSIEKIMRRLPLPLASALLAGVLSRFALDAFAAVPGNPGLVLGMIAAYIAGRRFWPRVNVPIVLGVGIAIAAAQGLFHLESVPWQITRPVFTKPEFTTGALIGVAIPLFIVTMASQNLPGVSALRVAGYEPKVSRVIGWTGIANFLFAPFGAFALNLAAITAAFCVGPEAHPDPKRRYWAPICAGLIYCVIGLFGATVAALLIAFPHALVITVAGLALLVTIGNAMTAALAEKTYHEASVVTFFVVLSGLSMHGIGSAFWGILAGAIVLIVQTFRK
ncbi:MAG: benzoate transporter [Akkermansiaceae bacterium]|nr:benzoate transporter [Akkermansiaceae bacterium]